MLPNFQQLMHRVINIRDASLGNDHELYIGDTETDAITAGAILQDNGFNPRIEKRDRNLVEALFGDAGPGQSLLMESEFYACRFSLENFDRRAFRKSQTFWIRFNENTRLTKARYVGDEATPDETTLTIYFEIDERL